MLPRRSCRHPLVCCRPSSAVSACSAVNAVPSVVVTPAPASRRSPCPQRPAAGGQASAVESVSAAGPPAPVRRRLRSRSGGCLHTTLRGHPSRHPHSSQVAPLVPCLSAASPAGRPPRRTIRHSACIGSACIGLLLARRATNASRFGERIKAKSRPYPRLAAYTTATRALRRLDSHGERRRCGASGPLHTTSDRYPGVPRRADDAQSCLSRA